MVSTEGIRMNNLINVGKPILENYYVRPMKTTVDFKAASEIEKTSQENHWTISDLKKTIQSHGVLGDVIVENLTGDEVSTNKVVAFFVYEYEGENIHILNFVVRPDCRRKKLGSAMMTVLKNRLSEKIVRLKFNVRESNEDAHYFLKSNGFIANKVERNYFLDCNVYGEELTEDAYCFSYTEKKLKI